MKVTYCLRSKWILSSNAFLVEYEGNAMLIDASTSSRSKELVKFLTKRIKPNQLKLIVLTHTHYDHVGGLTDVKKEFPKAEIVVHQTEAGNLRKGEGDIPKGNSLISCVTSWGGNLLKKYSSFSHYPKIDPDIYVNEKLNLEKYGFPKTYVLHTPGHSKGSMSVIVNNTTAFVGDAMNYNWSSVYNPLADDVSLNVKQWIKLLELGVEEFYPGHGTVISRKVVQRVLKRHLSSNKNKND